MGPPSGPAPVIPGYRDLSYLGHGATSVVYRGLEVEFNRYVAVKVLGSDDPEDPARARFEREKSVIGRLGEAHRNIVRVYRAGLTEDGRPFVSMQLYDGSAQDWIDANGSFPVEQAAALMVAIADATDAAHAAGILHRDIKPQNVLLSSAGPGLADFGIARATAALDQSLGLAQLTPWHAPPEAFEDGVAPDARTDIWSLGSTLYTMLAGRPPFAGSPTESMIAYHARLRRDPLPHIPRGDLPDPLRSLLARALAKDPAERFPTAAAFRDALAGAGVPLPAAIVAPALPQHGPRAGSAPASGAATAGGAPASAASVGQAQVGAASVENAPTTDVTSGWTVGDASTPVLPDHPAGDAEVGIGGETRARGASGRGSGGTAASYDLPSPPTRGADGDAAVARADDGTGAVAAVWAPGARSAPGAGPGVPVGPPVSGAGEGSVGEETVARTRRPPRRPPPEAEQPRTGRWRRRVLVGVGAVLVAFAGAVVVRGLTADDSGDPDDTVPIDDPQSAPEDRFAAEEAPADFTALDQGDTVELRWSDRSDGTQAYVVSVFRDAIEGEPEQTLPVDAGLNAVTVRQLDPEAAYCFRLVGVGHDAEGDRYTTAVDQQVRGCTVELPPDQAASG